MGEYKESSVIWKICKKAVAILLSVGLILIGYVILSVHYWALNEAGRLPLKTAVILHAVNNNIITSDMKPPDFLVKKSPPTMAREDIIIPVSDGEHIQGRIFYPKKEGPHPIIVYYHGGAFLEGYGNIDTHDNVVRALAARTNSVVLAVGYRVAPKYVFPTAVEDCYDALQWIYENGQKYHGDPSRIAVVGDSAGGNLAAAVTLMARDLQEPAIKAQALLYPLTTFQEISFDSRDKFDSGYFLLSRSVMYRARELYTPEEEMWASPYTSPLQAPSLAGLPPALIITAQFDPLFDEGKLYAERLVTEGVNVSHLHYQGVMHGFISFFEVMQMGEHGLRETTTFLKTQLAKESQQEMRYESLVIEGPEGKARFRDWLESYLFAAFLLYQAYFE